MRRNLTLGVFTGPSVDLWYPPVQISDTNPCPVRYGLVLRVHTLDKYAYGS